ncbi:MAG TPA: OmpA family protein [Myxococcales bacterium]|nr:OmpA family protein [Myxococcales bacterium]
MLSALLAITVAAAPPAVDVELDAHGHPRAAGARLTAKGYGHFELSGELARAFGGELAYAGEGRAFLQVGPAWLGVDATVGTSLQGRAFAELRGESTSVRLALGYQHRGGALLADGADGVIGRAILADLRLESDLGPVVLYAQARGFRALPEPPPPPADPGEVEPTVPPLANPDCNAQAPAPADPNDVLGINAAVNGTLQSVVVYPGAGVRWKMAPGVALYGGAEWGPSGLLIGAGVSLSLERILALPAVGAPPPKPLPPAPRPWIEIHLSAEGAPVQGVAVLTGPRTVQVPVGADGVARAELEAGRWRAAFHSPGYLSRETAFVLEPDVPVYAEADLRRAPAARTAMLMRDEIRLLQPLKFLPGTARLLPESAAVLDEVADVIVHEPARNLQVVAHTDPAPGVDAESLTQGQADSVIGYLRQRVAPERLAGRGAGDQEPLFPNLFAEARSRNRRVVFELR